MIVTQTDLSCLSDDEVRRIVVLLRDAADGAPVSARRFTDRLAAALVRSLNHRRRLLAVAELDFLNDPDAEGDIVGPDDDPIADAVDELHPENGAGPV